MKIAELLEGVDPKRPYQVPYFSWYIGNRDPDVVKKVFNPFIAQAGKEMTALKGKWNGADRTFDFKTEEQAKAAEAKMIELRAEWKEMEKAFPAGSQVGNNDVANFFKHQKKVDKSFGR